MNIMGKGIFGLGIVVFLLGTVAAVANTWHQLHIPASATTLIDQFTEMVKQFWLPETLILGFVLIGLGLLTWDKGTPHDRKDPYRP
jgi:hypothetical protein